MAANGSNIIILQLFLKFKACSLKFFLYLSLWLHSEQSEMKDLYATKVHCELTCYSCQIMETICAPNIPTSGCTLLQI